MIVGFLCEHFSLRDMHNLVLHNSIYSGSFCVGLHTKIPAVKQTLHFIQHYEGWVASPLSEIWAANLVRSPLHSCSMNLQIPLQSIFWHPLNAQLLHIQFWPAPLRSRSAHVLCHWHIAKLYWSIKANQKVAPMFFASFSETAWNLNIKFYTFIIRFHKIRLTSTIAFDKVQHTQ